jgi:hypothetical protein
MKHLDRSRDIGDPPVVIKEKFLSSAILMAKEHQEPPIYRKAVGFNFQFIGVAILCSLQQVICTAKIY